MIRNFNFNRGINPERIDNNNNVYISGFPRSGNSWISYLVSYCLNLPFKNVDVPKVKWDAGFIESKERKGLLRFLKGRNNFSKIDKYKYVIKTHSNPNKINSKDNIIITIVRNPEDVLTSLYHFYKLKLSVSSNPTGFG